MSIVSATCAADEMHQRPSKAIHDTDVTTGMEHIMQRRHFLLQTAAALAATGLAAAGCTTTATTTTSDANMTVDRRRRDIASGVDTTLTHLYSSVRGSRELVAKAAGVLVFPSVIAAGLGIG